MELQIKSKDEVNLRFELNGVSYSFANMLRRTLMRDIPIYAIDSIVVYENTTELIDEYIANRLGEVPLITPLHADSKPREIVLTLDATVSGQQFLYSRDLSTNDSVVRVALENIPLFIASEGKALRLEAKARVGYGRQHAKFQACSCAYEQKSNNSFSFLIEGFYQKKPQDILKEGLEIISKKTENYLEMLDKL